ncbi:MAG: hypothetical protein RIS88_2455 [Pseudomonadota bacterium]|jgi:hypothetical protein
MNRPPKPLSHALAAAALAGMAYTAAAADAPAAAASQGAASASPVPAPRAARTEAATTRQALETLLGSLPPRTQAEGPPRQRTTAQRGETLDAAIRRTMGDMPFKENFLRGVFLELNAGAVQPGTTRLIAGAQLQVPHLEDLRSHLQRVLGPQQAMAAQAAAPAAADKRHWVRFP